MSWLTPELIDILIAALKAIVILLAVVITGALLWAGLSVACSASGKTVTGQIGLARSAPSSSAQT